MQVDMQIWYIVGAFVMGFLIAWFFGRRGPKNALEESEANAHSLQRNLDERNRNISKLETQTKERQAQVDKLSTDSASLTTLLKASEAGLTDAGTEIARLQEVNKNLESEQLRLQSELAHARDALSGAREQAAALQVKLDAALATVDSESADLAAETALATTTADEVTALNAQVATLRTEVDLARAAAARMATMAALRPQLTPAKRAEYAALAGQPERIVAALHERDMAIADATNEAEYLRRNLSTMSAAGSELATTLSRRNSEYDLLLRRLSDLTATEGGQFATYASEAASRQLPMMAGVGAVTEIVDQTSAEEVASVALLQELEAELDARAQNWMRERRIGRTNR